MKDLFIGMGLILVFLVFSLIAYQSGKRDGYREIFNDGSYQNLNHYKLSLPENIITDPQENEYKGDYLVVRVDHSKKILSLDYPVIPPEYTLTVDKLGISIYSKFILIDQVPWDSTHLIKDIILRDNE